jgi:hypothetical protein
MRRSTDCRFAAAFVAAAFVLLGNTGAAMAQEASAADAAQARELYNEGRKLREGGDTTAAFEKLKAAHALVATPLTALELGRTYVLLGKLVEARDVLLSVERIPVVPQETARSANARAESAKLAAELGARIPRVSVRILDAEPSAVSVDVDGATVPPGEVTAPRPVDPGPHSILATSVSGKAHATVDLKEGDAVVVELRTAAPNTPPSSAANPEVAPPPSSTNARVAKRGWSPAVWTAFGVAGAGVVVGGITGGIALSKASAVTGACDGLHCPTTIDGDLRSGRTLGDISTVAFIVAGLGAAIGVVDLLLSHQENPAKNPTGVGPWIRMDGAGIRGAF